MCQQVHLFAALLALPKPNVQQSRNTQSHISFQNVYYNVGFKTREWAVVTINTGQYAFYRKLLINITTTWYFQPSNPHQVRYTSFAYNILKII